MGTLPQIQTSLGERDLALAATVFASGLGTAARRGFPMSVSVFPLLGSPPSITRVAVCHPSVQTTTFHFAQVASPDCTPSLTGRPSEPRAGKACERPWNTRSATRIRPPADTIRLQDRLFYLLQPPVESLLVGESLGFPFPPFPYQLAGIAFLYPRHAAVLADEMGLGKTMQAINATRLLLRSGEVRSVLLVCPKPLVSNWVREFGLWAPEVPTAVIEGTRARRCWQWHQRDVPVCVANYELLVRDREPVEAPECQFDLVILDEAQRIKNRQSTTSQVVRNLHRRRSWALTGTPVENSPHDLLGVFEFIAPGSLHESMSPRQMGRAASDYILRRTKNDVLTDLPPKLFRDTPLELTVEQRRSYELAESEGLFKLAALGPALSIRHVFELVMRLKQICNFDPASGASSKLQRLESDLEEVAASGHKGIIFSQWVTTLKFLSRNLREHRPLEYHGQVPQQRRSTVLSRFREDPHRHVLLISYGVGSVGLNLQFADYVFLFDRWWNPAVEDQAINRAHRIGATGPVTVTRFVSLGTIEERIDGILRKKRELFETILSQTGEPHNLGLTRDDLFALFNLPAPGTHTDAA